MTIPPLNTFPAWNVNLDPSEQPSLPVMAWMQNFTATNIPQQWWGVLTAQGWKPSGSAWADTSTTPPTYYCNFSLEGMTSSAVLQSLVNVYTNAYNEGRYMNALRYNQLVTNWSGLIDVAIQDANAVGTANNTFVTAYLASLDGSIIALDNLITGARTETQAFAADMWTKVDSLYSKVAEHDTNYTSLSPTITTLIAGETTALGNFVANYTTELDALEGELGTYTTAILADLSSALGALSSYITDAEAKLGLLETERQAYRNEVTPLLADELATLTTALVDHAAQLADIDTASASLQADVAAAVTDEGTAMADHIAAHGTELVDLGIAGDAYQTAIPLVIAEQAAALAAYILAYDTAVTTLLATFSTHLTATRTIESNANTNLTNHATAFGAKLDELATKYDDHQTAMETVLANAENAFTSHDTEIREVLAQLVTDQSGHAGDITTLLGEATNAFGGYETNYEGAIAALGTDWSSHAETATSFLVDLGTTELARINEEWDNRLAAAIQELIDAGRASSSSRTTLATRIARERSEAIAAHNDKLAREKWENEHRLYEQKTGMRRDTLTSFDRLHGVKQEVLRYKAESFVRVYGQLQEMRGRTMAGEQALYSLNQGLRQFQEAVYNGLHERTNAVTLRTAEGLQQIQSLRQTLSDWLLGDQHRLYEEQIARDLQVLTKAEKQHAAQQALYGAKIGGLDTLFTRKVEELRTMLAGLESEHAAKQGVYAAVIAQKDALFARILQDVTTTMAGILAQYQATAEHDRSAEALYGQLFGALQSVYLRHLEEIDRKAALSIETYRGEAGSRASLLQLIEGVRGKLADAIDRQHTAEQAVTTAQTAQYDRLLTQAQTATTQVADGYAKANQLRQSNGDFVTSNLHRLLVAQMELTVRTLEMKAGRQDQQMDLIKWQVDMTNNLVVGLFGFQERREDAYPSLESIATLLTQLGNTGTAPWLSP